MKPAQKQLPNERLYFHLSKCNSSSFIVVLILIAITITIIIVIIIDRSNNKLADGSVVFAD
ncbi:GD16556 [Drosophila simulans]|uniref:GD16556 n=1 Tax=Drosophila simulans TaxID=7240 RepID=B4R2P3_DROSI|nr:GD16556 [Drosophila simulans]